LGRLRPRDRRIPRRLRVPWRRSDLQGLYGIRCRAQGRSAFGRGSAKVLRLLERGARRRRVRRIHLPAAKASSRSHASLIVSGETAKVSRRKPSPAGPKAEPGIVARLCFSSSWVARSQEFSPQSLTLTKA